MNTLEIPEYEITGFRREKTSMTELKNILKICDYNVIGGFSDGQFYPYRLVIGFRKHMVNSVEISNLPLYWKFRRK